MLPTASTLRSSQISHAINLRVLYKSHMEQRLLKKSSRTDRRVSFPLSKPNDGLKRWCNSCSTWYVSQPQMIAVNSVVKASVCIAIISLNSIWVFLFITQIPCVYCEVYTEIFHKSVHLWLNQKHMYRMPLGFASLSSGLLVRSRHASRSPATGILDHDFQFLCTVPDQTLSCYQHSAMHSTLLVRTSKFRHNAALRML